MPEYIWTWLLNPLLTNGVLGVTVYLLRDLIAKFFSKSVEHRFEKQMEMFKAEIRDNEKELDHIRSFLTSTRRERDSALQAKRFEAAEVLLRAHHSLSQLSMLVQYMKILDGAQILKSADDPQVTEFIETLIKPFEIEEKISALGLLDKTLARLYLSNTVLQVFDVYKGIIIQSATMMKIYSIPLRDKGDLVKASSLREMIIELVPWSKEGFERFGEGYVYYWDRYFHDEVLRLLRQEVSGMDDTSRDVKSAAQVALESRQALTNVRSVLSEKGLSDTLMKTDQSAAASSVVEKLRQRSN